MKVLLSMISLSPLLLIHNVLGKPAKLLDLYFDLAPPAANGSSTKIEARTEEAQCTHQTQDFEEVLVCQLHKSLR